MSELITIADYLQEYDSVSKKLRDSENPRERKQLAKYARRLAREIKEFDRNRGTNYCKNIII